MSRPEFRGIYKPLNFTTPGRARENLKALLEALLAETPGRKLQEHASDHGPQPGKEPGARHALCRENGGSEHFSFPKGSNKAALVWAAAVPLLLYVLIAHDSGGRLLRLAPRAPGWVRSIGVCLSLACPPCTIILSEAVQVRPRPGLSG